MEYCERPNCGGWMKEIIDPENKIEKICAKCSRSANFKHEKKIEQERLRHTEFNVLFRAMCKEKIRTYRIQKKLLAKEEKRV